MSIRLPYLMLLTLCALGFFYGTSSQGLNASQTAGITTLDDRTFDLTDPATLKLVSFYSPDCSISLKDIAHLSELHQQFGASEVDVIAVAMPYDSKDRISEFENEHSPEYHLAHDADGSIASAFPNVRFTPTTFLIDNAGQIVWRHTGAMPMDEVRTGVAAALNQRVTATDY